MRKTLQLILCLCAVVSLVVTGIAFYQIVLASTIHGAPVRFIETQAGPYPLKLALYSDSIQAGAIIPFALAVGPRPQGPLTYQVTASPGPGVPGSLARRQVRSRSIRSRKGFLCQDHFKTFSVGRSFVMQCAGSLPDHATKIVNDKVE